MTMPRKAEQSCCPEARHFSTWGRNYCQYSAKIVGDSDKNRKAVVAESAASVGETGTLVDSEASEGGLMMRLSSSLSN